MATFQLPLVKAILYLYLNLVIIVLAFITSRLDYCNSILAGVPLTTLEPLQRVQNAAVRLIFELGMREHVTPGLLQLHWLPVRWRILFKLCMLMHSIRTAKCPTYLNNIVATIASSSSRSGLRSSTSTDLYVTPRLRTKLGERAFSFAGPAAWNALPVSIRTESNQTKFKQVAQLSQWDALAGGCRDHASYIRETAALHI